MLTLSTFLLLLAAPPSPYAGEVKLPLREYLALVERIEAQDAERVRALSRVEPSVAELVSQRVSVSTRDGEADVNTTFEIEVRGPIKATVALPLTGMAERVTIEPPGAAAVRWAPGGLELVAPAAGRYKVQVAGRLEIQHEAGMERLLLAPMSAPVSELVLSLPAERAWRCAKAVVAEDAVEAGRRRLRLALPRAEAVAIELRRETKAQDPPTAIAAAVSVTVVSLGRDVARRHDIVLFEVQRGEMGTMALTLPAGLEPDSVVTDEGPAMQWLDGRTLRVERAKKLTGAGYVAVASQPASRDAIPLEGLLPETKLRARYLAYASGIAADFAPEPAASWSRADVTDLPEAVQQVAGALGIVAAWRLRQDDAPGRLKVAALPAPKLIDTVVTQRDTTTLLTVENTLLHRDRFTVEGDRPSLEVALPPNGTVWSAQVADVPVRPVEQGGRVLVPLGLAASGPRTVEVVIVQERAIAPGRSTLDLALPELSLPVLKHEWRVLLPERNRYRYSNGSLRPVGGVSGGVGGGAEGGRPGGVVGAVVGGVPGGVVGGVVGGLPSPAPPSNVALGTGGGGQVRGNVLDATGAAIPGASVRLTDERTGRVLAVVTRGNGEFHFGGLAGSSYSIRADLAGFRTMERRGIRVASGESRSLTLTLEVGAVAESVQVAGDRDLSYRAASKDEKKAAEQTAQMQQAAEFRDELGALKQGLVGGVKPLPVKIPESGKVLHLAGALPPSRVTVSLEVKAPKE